MYAQRVSAGFAAAGVLSPSGAQKISMSVPGAVATGHCGDSRAADQAAKQYPSARVLCAANPDNSFTRSEAGAYSG